VAAPAERSWRRERDTAVDVVRLVMAHYTDPTGRAGRALADAGRGASDATAGLRQRVHQGISQWR